MFTDPNFLFAILLIMLYVSVIIDSIALYNIFIKRSDEAINYAAAGLKCFKIIFVFFLGAVMLIYSFTVLNAPIVTIAEFVLGLLLIADGILSVIAKKKYGGMK